MPKEDPETFDDIRDDLREEAEEDSLAIVKNFIKEAKAWTREWWDTLVDSSADQLWDTGGLMLGRDLNRDEKAECKVIAREELAAALNAVRGQWTDILDELIDRIEG